MPIENDGSLTVDQADTSIGVDATNSADVSTSADAAAPSSSAPQGETKEDLLSAVISALPESATKDDPDTIKLGSEEAPASTQPNSEKSDADAQAPEIDLDQDPTKEELGRYHSRTRKRIEKLLHERNAAREEAQVTRGLKEFLTSNDIAKEDFQLTLDLAASMRKGDFRAFLEGVAPYVQLAQEALGLALPQDLHQQVQQGYMTTEAASRMSQERYARMRAEAEATRLAMQQQTQTATVQQQALSQNVEQTVSAWEAQTRRTDPDYGRKEDAVKNFLWAVVRERGAPQTPQQAVEIAQEAYSRANNMFRSFAPPPKPTRPVPSSVNRTVGVKPEPKSLMEAAMIGLENARR